ncbi:hypothetical protein ACLXAZ_33415, partial [Escherichia coli]
QYSTAADPPGGVLTSASFGQVRDYDLSTGDQWELGSKFDFLDGRGSATLAAQYSTAADPPGGVLTSASFGQVRDYDLSTGDQWE